MGERPHKFRQGQQVIYQCQLGYIVYVERRWQGENWYKVQFPDGRLWSLAEWVLQGV